MKFDFAKLEDMVLESAVGAREEGGKVFQAKLGELPESTVRKVLSYGFQRLVNDRIGGKDVATKVAETSIFVASLIDGSWVNKARANAAPKVDEWTEQARAFVWSKLDKAKRKALADDPAKGAKNEYLDAVIAKNKDKPAFDAKIKTMIEAARKLREKADGIELDL